MPEVATKEYIDRKLESMEQNLKRDLMHAIEQIGKPERITSSEVAQEWGVTNKTAIKRLKKMHRKGQIQNVDFDSRPITVNRHEFHQSLNN